MAAASQTGRLRAAGERKTNYYVIQNYLLKQGTQAERLHTFLREGWLPAVGKIDSGPKIVMEAQVAVHTPQVAVIAGAESMEALESARARLEADATYRKAREQWETGVEAPYESYSQTLVRAAGYAADIPAQHEKPKTPRILELRIYHSPTTRQLAALHQRFSTHEIGIFHRCGIYPLLYGETAFGPDMPNLTYLIPFEDLAAREKAWAAFGADPEWVKVRKESIDQSGQLTVMNQISLYRATAYSPVG
jgi:hypothetical protein